MRVLYIQHVGIMGGSGRSLFEMIMSFPKGTIKPYVICPKGLLSNIFSKEKIPVIYSKGLSNFNNTNYGYYRSWRWLILIREFAYILPSIYIVLKARVRWGRFDIIHINEVTMPLLVIIIKCFFWKTPVIVHARATQRKVENLRSLILSTIDRLLVNRIISINQTVASSFPFGTRTDIVHNGMVPPIVKKSKIKKNKRFTIGMVGLLNKSKGCADFIEAAKICKIQGYDFQFHFIGGGSRKVNRFYDFLLDKFKLNQNLETKLRDQVVSNNLQKTVKFLPFQRSLNAIYEKLDLVCFPTLDPAPGRPIFEAGFFSVPAITCIEDPKDDTFVQGVTGLNNRPGDPAGIAKDIIFLHTNPDILAKMGRAAKNLSARNFNSAANGKKIIAIYEEELGI